MSWDTFHSIFFCIPDIEYYFTTRDGQIIWTRTYPKPEVKNQREDAGVPARPGTLGTRESDEGCRNDLRVSWPTFFLFLFSFFKVCLCMYLFIYLLHIVTVSCCRCRNPVTPRQQAYKLGLSWAVLNVWSLYSSIL